MNRLPTNHAIILGNVNFEFDVKTYHTQHHLTRNISILSIIIIIIMIIISNWVKSLV